MRYNYKPLYAGLLAALLATTAAHAQFQPQPQNPGRNSTYVASAGVTSAASATDIFNLKGSASRVVTVTSVECNGIATTAGVANLSLIKRSAANSGGTSTAPTVVPTNSGLPAGTAALLAYTANPTVGTVVGTVGAKTLGMPLATGGGAPSALWNFVSDQFNQPVVLNGVAESLSVNGNGVTLPAGAVLNCTFTWTES